MILSPRTRRILPFVLVAVIAATTRLIGVGWGLPQLYHCDERRVILSSWKYATGKTEKPIDVVYTPLPAYLSALAHGLSGGRVAHTPASTARFLRTVSALASVLTPLVLFFAVGLIFDSSAGFIAALALSFAPGAIREAHFATVDSLLTFGLVCAMASALWVVYRPRSRWWFLLPVSVGLAVAVKISALPSVILLLLFMPRVSTAGSKSRILTAPLIMGLTFGLLAWNMVINPRQYAFWIGMSGLARTGAWIPYSSLQFHRTQPLGGLISLFWMGGPFLLAGGILGTPLLLRRMFQRPVLALAILLPLGAGTMECLMGRVPFVRTALAALPLLALSCAALFIFLKRSRPVLARTAISLMLAGTAWAGVSYWRLYLEPDTRTQTSAWVRERRAEDEFILLDGSDGLLNLPGIPDRFQRNMRHPAQERLHPPMVVERLSIKDRLLFRLAEWGATRPKEQKLLDTTLHLPPLPPSPERSSLLRSQLQGITWIVTTGTELERYRAHPEICKPEIGFYTNLLAGKLDFTHEEFSCAPELRFPHSLAPEPTWYLFDHPTITILKRTGPSVVASQ